MSTYAVMPRVRQSGFKIEVTAGDGSRHTILGFETEAEAVGWTKADKASERFRFGFSADAD
jgi:hypothetical protein